MSKKILSELYYGNISPETKMVVSGSDYHKNQVRFCDTTDALNEKLNEEEKAMLETIINALGEMSMLSSEESFIDGFKLGAKMILEIFEKENGQLKSIRD